MADKPITDASVINQIRNGIGVVTPKTNGLVSFDSSFKCKAEGGWTDNPSSIFRVAMGSFFYPRIAFMFMTYTQIAYVTVGGSSGNVSAKKFGLLGNPNWDFYYKGDGDTLSIYATGITGDFWKEEIYNRWYNYSPGMNYSTTIESVDSLPSGAVKF